MAGRLKLNYFNDAYMKVDVSEPHILEEMASYMTFDAPNYQFDYRYKSGKWDGKVRLLDRRGNKIYVGLLKTVEEFCKTFQYELEIDEKIMKKNNVTFDEVVKFVDHINPYIEIDGELKKPHDFQYKAVFHAINRKRVLLLSPTGSGKSLIAYLTIRYLQSTKSTKRILLIVPTTSLVEQMYKDFDEYSTGSSWDVSKNCHRIHAEYFKQSHQQVFISTWQSIYDQPQAYFNQFNAVIVDEVHGAKAESITGIMKSLKDCKYRVGMTGTLDDVLTHILILQGLFGNIKRVASTKELMDRGILTPVDIKVLWMKYPKNETEIVRSLKYQDEMDYLCSHTKRNLLIKNLALSTKGNTLVLFQFVEKHGDILRSLIERDADSGRKVFYVFGGTEVTQREEIRKIVKNEKDAIIVASFGTFSTGINIPNIENIIFASPSKSKIRILQSIGRGVRLAIGKLKLYLFDLVDDFTHDGESNYVLDHATERFKFYKNEQFETEIHKIDM